MSKQLNVFQRTPIWCFPKADVPLPAPARLAMRIPGGKIAQRLLSQAYVEVTFTLSAQYYTVFPIAKRAEAAARSYLRQQVRDPVVRDKLTPRYAVGCKRPGFHNTYLSTYNRDNVALVTDPIDKITRSGVVTADGEYHDVDVLILATGFKVMDIDSSTFALTGSEGRSLADFWNENRLQAYEGVSIPGFPNFFCVCGPYGYVGSSYFALIETQTRHIVRCLTRADRHGAHRVEVRGAGQRPLLRRDDAQATPADLLAGQLRGRQQLLLRQERRRAAAAGHHAGRRLAQPPVRPRRLRVHELTQSQGNFRLARSVRN